MAETTKPLTGSGKPTGGKQSIETVLLAYSIFVTALLLGIFAIVQDTRQELLRERRTVAELEIYSTGDDDLIAKLQSEVSFLCNSMEGDPK